MNKSSQDAPYFKMGLIFKEKHSHCSSCVCYPEK